VSDAAPSEESDTLSHSRDGSGTTQALTGQSRPTTDTTATTPALCGAGPDRMSDSPGAVPDRVADTSDTCPRAFADVPATLTSDGKRLADAVDIVRTHGHLSGSDMARRHVRAHRPAVARPRRGTPTAAPDSGPCRLSDKAGHPTAHGTSRDPRCAVGRHREGIGYRRALGWMSCPARTTLRHDEDCANRRDSPAMNDDSGTAEQSI